MKRSTFFLITAILAFLFGGLMLLAAPNAADGFGLSPSPEVYFLLRFLGGMLVSMGIVNLVVRSHEDSATLKAVLLMNIAVHVLGMLNDIMGAAGGVLPFGKVVPGFITHFFVGIGSAFYYVKMKLQPK